MYLVYTSGLLLFGCAMLAIKVLAKDPLQLTFKLELKQIGRFIQGLYVLEDILPSC